MRNVSRVYPTDHHVSSFFADSLMNTIPWDYYTEGRAALGHTFKPAAAEARQVLEKVLREEPTHEGAIHLYIHLLEAGDEAGLAQPFAEELARLAPGASHLVHMPSHTFMHTGHWDDAAAVNAAATYDAPRPGGPGSDNVYPLHNREFLVWALRIEGRSAEALSEARKLTAIAQPCAVDHVHCSIPGCHRADSEDPLAGRRYQRFSAAWPLTVALLGDQPELTELEAAPPPVLLEYHTAMWHFAIGMVNTRLAAAASRRRFSSGPDVQMHLDRAESARQQMSLACGSADLIGDSEDSYSHPVVDLCSIAKAVLGDAVTAAVLQSADEHGEGGSASAEAASAESLSALRAASLLEDRLEYDEPPTQFFPSRHFLGAALLRAASSDGTHTRHTNVRTALVQEAVGTYEQALVDFPGNGWALHGLTAALEAGGVASIRKVAGAANTAAAARIAEDRAWERADVVLVDSATIDLPARRASHAPASTYNNAGTSGGGSSREDEGSLLGSIVKVLFWVGVMGGVVFLMAQKGSRKREREVRAYERESGWRGAAQRIVTTVTPPFGEEAKRAKRDEHGELDRLI